jgi:hypothetical protein
MNEFYQVENENDSYVEIHITKNKYNGVVFIDLEDLDRVIGHTWYLMYQEKKDAHYVSTEIGGKIVKLHRFVLGLSEKEGIVDHIDRNRLNNRKSNLRLVTTSKNSHNSKFRTNNTSGRMGISLVKGSRGRSDRWMGKITIDNKIHKKTFSIELYGDEGALEMATRFREDLEKKHGVESEVELQHKE